jgi:hypothetical protein
METKEKAGVLPPGSKFKPVSGSFEEALKTIMQQNSRDDLIDAFGILVKLLENLVSLE